MMDAVKEKRIDSQECQFVLSLRCTGLEIQADSGRESWAENKQQGAIIDRTFIGVVAGQDRAFGLCWTWRVRLFWLTYKQ